MAIKKLTPKVAATMLEGANHNRPLSEKTINGYAHDMQVGNWTTPTIILQDNSGNLLDGFHRCHAVIASGVTIPYIPVEGDGSMFDVIDQGRPRTLPQVLATKGVDHPVSVAAAITAASTFERLDAVGTYGHGGSYKGRNRTMQEKLQLFDLHPDLQPISIEIGNRRSGASVRYPGGWVSALQSIANEIDLGENFATFVDGVFTGVGLDADNPAYVLRRRLLKLQSGSNRASQTVVEKGFWVITWNNYAIGREMSHLTWGTPSTGPKAFPKPLGLEEWSTGWYPSD